MTTTLSSEADVATDRPVPYLRQLCKHFGHRERFGRRDGLAVTWS